LRRRDVCCFCGGDDGVLGRCEVAACYEADLGSAGLGVGDCKGLADSSGGAGNDDGASGQVAFGR